MKNNYKLFHGLAMIYVTMLLVSNTIAVKLIAFQGFVLPAGILCFPVAYIFGDVLTEVYGYKKTKSIIWWGFACLALMSIFYYLAIITTPASFWKKQEEFSQIFGIVPRIALSSFIAYLVGSFLNAYIMSLLKVKTNGKHLWLRTISSTIVGEGADSVVFNLSAFLFVFPFNDVLYIAFSGFILKTLYEIIATPVTYIIVNKIKSIEHEDVYDKNISYNPFI